MDGWSVKFLMLVTLLAASLAVLPYVPGLPLNEPVATHVTLENATQARYPFLDWYTLNTDEIASGSSLSGAVTFHYRKDYWPSGPSSSPYFLVIQTATRSSSSTHVLSTRSMTTESSSETSYGDVWESEFGNGNLSGFNLGVDASVGCENAPPQISDIDRRIADDSTDPAHKGRVLEVVANVNERPGVFVNAISGRYVDFFDDAHYHAYGYFRKLPSDFQIVGVNLQLVQNYTEYTCLFYWRLNEFDKFYRWIVVRTTQGDVPVHFLGDDLQWHYFEIEGHYPANGDRRISHLRIDASTYPLDFPMPLRGATPHGF
jgi:hypothetical protein